MIPYIRQPGYFHLAVLIISHCDQKTYFEHDQFDPIWPSRLR